MSDNDLPQEALDATEEGAPEQTQNGLDTVESQDQAPEPGSAA